MDCPHCGEEIRGGNKCKKCGKKFLPSKEMEVQYKEFRVSELLDIKMTSSASQQKALKNHDPAPRNVDGSTETCTPEERRPMKRTRLFVFAIIALLAAMAGFYLLRFLLWF
ncbi:MAG TPA: hypothetical protein VEI46_04195 [Thermodesulfovibrionales bacterium]|nr:hypothetical protein [Thermodesulfovibrionales bacterium]